MEALRRKVQDTKGIRYERVKALGSEHVVWEEGAGEVMKQYMGELAQRCAKRRSKC